ncbi:unnamed protein product, partial [marine sediment metagenome]
MIKKMEYDKEGNLLPQTVNYEVNHDDYTKDEIREITKKKEKIEKRTFFCLKCN